MSSSSFAVFFAQVTNAAAAAGAVTPGADAAPGAGRLRLDRRLLFPALIMAMVYFALIRPQAQAKKKQEETIKSAKTGDKIVTISGIHGFITNVKDTTVIVKVADNVKLEIEKSHIDKITRPDSSRFGKDRHRQGLRPDPFTPKRLHHVFLHPPRLTRLHRLFHLVPRG